MLNSLLYIVLCSIITPSLAKGKLIVSIFQSFVKKNFEFCNIMSEKLTEEQLDELVSFCNKLHIFMFIEMISKERSIYYF